MQVSRSKGCKVADNQTLRREHSNMLEHTMDGMAEVADFLSSTKSLIAIYLTYRLLIFYKTYQRFKRLKGFYAYVLLSQRNLIFNGLIKLPYIREVLQL